MQAINKKTKIINDDFITKSTSFLKIVKKKTSHGCQIKVLFALQKVLFHREYIKKSQNFKIKNEFFNRFEYNVI